MKFDLHCHTREGSLDSRVSILKYISEYKKLGYDGFMIADHNTYRGCKAWDELRNLPELEEELAGFTVIRGLEYDTKDAGHVLVVMPDDVYLRLLHIRGMRLRKLIYVVHSCGGVLGLAHPFGAASSSAMGFTIMNYDLIEQLDFIEVFNTCEAELSNYLAKELAAKYELPGTAGTDAHREEYIGMAFTEIDADIRCNNDFIEAIQNGAAFRATGTEREETSTGKAKEHWTGVIGYKVYNRGIAKVRSVHRKLGHYRLTHNSDMADKFEKEWKDFKKESKK
ncbi:MAG: CehA/McbA family metallohydrolase [Bacillota bacterium]